MFNNLYGVSSCVWEQMDTGRQVWVKDTLDFNQHKVSSWVRREGWQTKQSYENELITHWPTMIEASVSDWFSWKKV